MMTVVIAHYVEELETLSLPIRDVSDFIDLIKAHPYVDSTGEYYKFESAQVEPNLNVQINVEKDE